MVESVLTNATRIKLFTAPYVYAILDNVLSEEYYNQLAASYPTYQQIIPFDRFSDGVYQQNRRYHIPAVNVLDGSAELSPVWREFVEYHTSHRFYQEVIGLIGDQIRKTHPFLERRLGNRLEQCSTGVRFASQADISLDCQISINTPVETLSSVRRVHTDARTELFAMLFYMRMDEDDSVGGNLEIYRWKSSKKLFIGTEVEEEDAEWVDSIEYRKNTLVFFINSDYSLHAVSNREPTTHIRRFVNIIGEVDQSIPEGLFKTPKKYEKKPWYKKRLKLLRRFVGR